MHAPIPEQSEHRGNAPLRSPQTYPVRHIHTPNLICQLARHSAITRNASPKEPTNLPDPFLRLGHLRHLERHRTQQRTHQPIYASPLVSADCTPCAHPSDSLANVNTTINPARLSFKIRSGGNGKQSTSNGIVSISAPHLSAMAPAIGPAGRSPRSWLAQSHPAPA